MLASPGGPARHTSGRLVPRAERNEIHGPRESLWLGVSLRSGDQLLSNVAVSWDPRRHRRPDAEPAGDPGGPAAGAASALRGALARRLDLDPRPAEAHGAARRGVAYPLGP